MIEYIVIELIIFLWGICSWNGKKNKNLFWPGLMLILFSGMRGDFTSDYTSYANYFHRINRNETLLDILNFKSKYSMEKGYVLLNKFVGIFSESSVVYFIVISALTMILLIRFIKRYSPIPWLSLFLFVTIGDYFASFNLVRQVLAAAICLNAIDYVKKKDIKRYILIIVIAASIHASALIMIPMYFILQMRIEKKIFLIYGLCCGILFMSLDFVINIGQNIFPKYRNYSYGMKGGTINAIIPYIGILMFICYSLYFKKTDCDMDSVDNKICFNSLIWTLIFGVLAIKVYIFNRFMYFFKPFTIVLIPNILRKYQNSKERNSYIISIVVLGILFTLITLSGTGYDPYYTILGEI